MDVWVLDCDFDFKLNALVFQVFSCGSVSENVFVYVE